MTEAKAVFVAEEGKLASGTIHFDLGAAPEPTPYYFFQPAEDITVIELAEILRAQLVWNRWDVAYIELLPERVRRHFQEVAEIVKSEAPVIAENSVFSFRAQPKGLVWADDPEPDTSGVSTSPEEEAAP